jgi:hypothetical protein
MGVNYNSGSIITNGLVLCLDAANSKSYPGSGTTWTDLSGRGNTGTLVNGVGYNSANLGSLSFDGVDDYINCGNILNFTTESFTFNMFFYITSIITNAYDQGPVLFYKGNFAGVGYYCQLSLTNPSNINFVTNQPGTFQYTQSSALISVGTWNCCSVVRNGSSVKIYINGVDATAVPEIHLNPASSSQDFQIASYLVNNINGNIKVSSFQAYNRALSAAEVLQNFNATKSRFL